MKAGTAGSMFITPTYNFIGKRHFQMGLGCLFSCMKRGSK
nr:MAG TPA: hypothetical protein [Caudoviricetes sp.]